MSPEAKEKKHIMQKKGEVSNVHWFYIYMQQHAIVIYNVQTLNNSDSFICEGEKKICQTRGIPTEVIK